MTDRLHQDKWLYNQYPERFLQFTLPAGKLFCRRLGQQPGADPFFDFSLVVSRHFGRYQNQVKLLRNNDNGIALEMNDNNVSKAAKALKINRTTLYSRVQKLGSH